MKKLLSIILVAVLLVTAMPLGAFEFKVGAATSGYYTYSVSNGKATITDVNTSISGAVTIPSTLGGYRVTNIGGWAFEDCSSLTSITIPDSVTSIGYYAFYKCTSLTSITIPDSVTSIGNGAFYNTGYYNNSSNWENNVLYIGNHLIDAKTSISGSYVIKSGTITIADSTFSSCSSLTSITIPDSVTSIGSFAFRNCKNLTNINVSSGNSKYSSNDGILFNKAKTTLICYPAGKTNASYVIPNSVTSIEHSAFYYCTSLTSITIPNSVTSIGDYAFSYCKSLTSITIPDSVTNIGDYAFRDCTSLTSITIPNSVTSIGDDAFLYCSSLTSIIIPDSVTRIGYSAFSNCTSLTSITIPNSVTSIGTYAFYYCTSLTSITIPDSVTNIGDYAFRDCTSLTSITIPNSVTSIGDYAFGWCESLTSITIPNSVTSIGDGAFRYCESLTSITIPNSVTSIGDYAFGWCDNLTSITLGKGVTSIGDSAFSYCSSLKTVYYRGSSSDKSKISIGSYNSYLTNATWYYNSCIGSVNHTYDDAGDANCNICNLARVSVYTYTVSNGKATITDVNTSISGAVTIPSTLGGYTVTSIGYDAFCDCRNITSITIPNSVTIINDWAFYYCVNLKSITIPSSVTSIGDYAFYYCESLKSVTVPSSVTSIGDQAFRYCYSLTSIDVSSANSNYSSYNGALFNKNKTKLVCYPVGKTNTSYDIPNSVTSIGDEAFEYCDSLISITIPNGVTSIGENAFSGCSSLTRIYYRGSSTNKSKISIGSNNSYLTNATWYYNSCIGSANHTYDNSCDSKCNVCNQTRTVPDHVYSNSCDTTCNVCGATRTITHNYKWVTDKAANCGVNGTKHEECTVCHTKRNTNTVIPATGNHTYDNSCDSKCNVCNQTRTVPAHVYSNSCDTTCNVCGATRTITHKYQWVTDKAANCGVNGTKHEECTVCHTKRNTNTVIYATGNHTYDNSCDSKCNVCNQTRTITHTYTNACDTVCNICGATRTITHNYKWVTDKAANCGVNGTKHEECTVCHTKRNTNTVIYATGNHNYDNDCDSECNVCKQTRTVPDHIYSNITDRSCNICDYIRVIIDSSTLTYDDSNGKATITDAKESIVGNLTIPAKLDGYTVTSIGEEAFLGCSSLESITIPDTVTSIGLSAFSGCENLTSITIGSGVTSIGDQSFWYCDSLTSIIVSSDNEQYSSDNGVLFDENKTTLIWYPSGKTDDSYAVPNSVTSISAFAFYYCNNLTRVTLPSGVTIDNWAFNDNVEFEYYVLGDIDGTGVVDLSDVTNIARYFAGWDVDVNEYALDTDGDGLINLNDLIHLAQYVAGWDVELL